MTITTHVCRGNFKSTWVSEGGYEPVAERLLGGVNYDGYFLEYDTDRSGGFEPLRFLPKGDKIVVLGLVTSKSGTLEKKDDIKRRIDEATKFAALEQFCLSPQCGFASTEEGNILAEDEQWAKFRMIVETVGRGVGQGLMLLPTTLVGSYPQPDWLIDRASLAKQMPPRVRARELWRIDPERLDAAQDDATLIAIRDQERAGLDIVTDGEQRRESYSNRFATALDGVDLDNPGKTPEPHRRLHHRAARGRQDPRRHPVEVRDVEFLRANTDRKIKMTVPGPFTMAQQCEDHHYRDEAALALDYAAAVNAEIKDLFAAGADVVQLDEPWMQARPEKAKAYGLAALDRALKGVTGTTAVHLCFGYAQMVKSKPSGYSFLPELERSPAQQISIEAAQPKLDLAVLKELPSKTIILGVIDLSDMTIETPRPSPSVSAARCRTSPPSGSSLRRTAA